MVHRLSSAVESDEKGAQSLTEEDYMITVMGATGDTGRTIAESLLKVGEKVCALGRSDSKLAELPRLNPTRRKSIRGHFMPICGHCRILNAPWL